MAKQKKERVATNFFKSMEQARQKESSGLLSLGRSYTKMNKEEGRALSHLKEGVESGESDKTIKTGLKKLRKIKYSKEDISEKKEQIKTTAKSEKFKALKKGVNKLGTGTAKYITRGKMLRKPSAQLQKLNAMRALTQGSGDYRFSREVEPRELIQDNRSLYFKEEFINEKERMRKWL